MARLQIRRDLVRHTVERELLRALEGGVRVVQTEDPLELEVRLRALLRIGLQLLLDPRLPGVQVPVQRTQAHAGGVAALEGGDARGVIAPEAVAHDDYLPRIDIRPVRYELVRRLARHFVIVARVDLAKAQRLALPRPVDRERINPSPRELQAREEHTHLLAVVHAVEEHHGSRTPRGVLRLHEIRRQRLAFRFVIGHFDELDVPVPALQPLLVAAQRLPVDAELALAGRHEALAGVVVVARAQVMVPGGEFAAIDRGGIGELLVFLRHRAPFLPPRVGVARAARGQPLADPVDLPDRDRAVRRHALADEGRVRPHEIAGKLVDPAALRHPCLRVSCLARKHSRFLILCTLAHRGGGIVFATPDDPKSRQARNGASFPLYEQPEKDLARMGTADFNSSGGEFSENRGAKERTAIPWAGQREIKTPRAPGARQLPKYASTWVSGPLTHAARRRPLPFGSR